MSNVPPDGYVSVPEAQAQLGIARQRAYQLVRMGVLPSIEVGGRTWIPQHAVDARIAADNRLNSSNCVSTNEAAEFFGVSVTTIRQWTRAGLLFPAKVNNRLCYDIQQIITFVPPRSSSTAGRYPSRQGTRRLRGRHFPPPEPPSKQVKGTSGEEPQHEPPTE